MVITIYASPRPFETRRASQCEHVDRVTSAVVTLHCTIGCISKCLSVFFFLLKREHKIPWQHWKSIYINPMLSLSLSLDVFHSLL